ncbi:MAG: hypothetical protein RDU13_10560 [Elusimicrobiales bacterium]|nr:hypothetical protein [Elusimicrobiales bacterium]
MRRSFLKSSALLAALCVPAGAADIDALTADLYSPDAAAREAAVGKLSALSSAGDISAAVDAFRRELACSSASPRPRKCHDPRAVKGMLQAAGAMAARDSGRPWDFLVWLREGGTVHDGSFFQDPEEAGDQREEGYFSPASPDPALTGEALDRLLSSVIRKAGVMPSCDWQQRRLKKMAVEKKGPENYSIYSYRRDYSPEGILGRFRVVHAMDWIYKEGKPLACGPGITAADLGKAGVFMVKYRDRSDEQYALDIEVYSLTEDRPACSYSVTGLSELEPDPLGEFAADPAKSLPLLFDFGPYGCRPKKIAGYEYSRLQPEK